MKAYVPVVFSAVAGFLIALPASAQGWKPTTRTDKVTGEEMPGQLSTSVGAGKWALLASDKTHGLSLILSPGVVTQCSPIDGCDLRVRIGDDAPRRMKFNDIGNKEVAIHGSGAHQIRAGIAGGNKVLIEVPLYNGAPVMVILNPDGFDNSFDARKK